MLFRWPSSLRTWLRGAAIALVAGLLSTTLLAQPATANLPPGNAITDPKSLLRYALPIENREIRQVQKDIEAISGDLRAKRWTPILKNVRHAAQVLALREDNILASIPADRQAKARDLIARLETDVPEFENAVNAKDKAAVQQVRNRFLDTVGDIEELMVTDFPFEIPAEYADKPQLLGRATVAVETTQGDLTLELDGYSAPITAGNFADLVKRGFYNGLPFTRAEDFYILQIGDPEGAATGFIDPKTKQERTIPLEILVDGETEPVYGNTFEEIGLYQAQPALPFSAFGTLGWARPGEDLNGGSSQFFFFLFEPELTPAGLNLIDGRYAAFGYVTEGAEVLEKLKPGDQILKARIVAGAENLKNAA